MRRGLRIGYPARDVKGTVRNVVNVPVEDSVAADAILGESRKNIERSVVHERVIG